MASSHINGPARPPDCACPRVLSIGDNAFEKFEPCSRLRTLLLPDSVHTVGRSAFKFNQGLERVCWPRRLQRIRSFAFAYCHRLSLWSCRRRCAISGPRLSVPAEGSRGRFGCLRGWIPWITSRLGCARGCGAELPDSLKTLGDGVFRECSGLAEVVLPDGLREISKYCFCKCSRLQRMRLPSRLEKIGNRAFSGCFSLEAVLFGPCLRSIGVSAFQHCARLTGELALPKGLQTIAVGAFEGAPGYGGL